MECSEARDLLLEALTGTTPPDVRRALRTHLEGCPACRREAEAFENTSALLRSVAEPRLSEGHWADFMMVLDRRLDAERNQPWQRVLRWIRNPIHAWSTAAATSAVVVALGLALLINPNARQTGITNTENAPVQAFMTERMVSAMPAMDASLAVWKASLGASEVSYDLSGGE